MGVAAARVIGRNQVMLVKLAAKKSFTSQLSNIGATVLMAA